MVTVVSDHFDVDRAKAFLDRGHTQVWRLYLAKKIRLEGDHPGAREQQGGVTERDQGGARQHLVVPLCEIVEKTLADLGAIHAGRLRARFLNCNRVQETGNSRLRCSTAARCRRDTCICEIPSRLATSA